MRTIVIRIFCSALLVATCLEYSSAAVFLNPATTVTPVKGEPDPATVKSAVDEFKALSKKEKKLKIKQVKKEIKAYKKQKRNGSDADTDTLLLVILAILLPPLAVYLYEDEINSRFWLSLILTLLFWIPGVIYALVLILGGY